MFRFRAISLPRHISLPPLPCSQDSSLEIVDVGLNPTRVAFLEKLREAGIDIAVVNQNESCHEPSGDLHVRGRKIVNKGDAAMLTINGTIIPQLIDELPLLAVVGSQIARRHRDSRTQKNCA